jgi:hypothetical protein
VSRALAQCTPFVIQSIGRAALQLRVTPKTSACTQHMNGPGKLGQEGRRSCVTRPGSLGADAASPSTLFTPSPHLLLEQLPNLVTTLIARLFALVRGWDWGCAIGRLGFVVIGDSIILNGPGSGSGHALDGCQVWPKVPPLTSPTSPRHIRSGDGEC